MAVKSEPDVILYRGNYPGWPWITAAGDRLLCAFRDDGVHGFSATGKVLWMESLDAGQSWSASRVAVADGLEQIFVRRNAIVRGDHQELAAAEIPGPRMQ